MNFPIYDGASIPPNHRVPPPLLRYPHHTLRHPPCVQHAHAYPMNGHTVAEGHAEARCTGRVTRRYPLHICVSSYCRVPIFLDQSPFGTTYLVAMC